MRLFSLFLIPCLAVVGIQSAQADTPIAAVVPVAASTTLLIVGDSISAGYGIQKQQGWVRLLQQRVDEQCGHIRVINAAVSGETTAGGLARLPALLARYKPAIVVFELGGNDGLDKLPLEHMRINLQRMISLSKVAGAKPVLLGMKIPLSYPAAYRAHFERVFSEVAASSGTPLLPFFLDHVAQVPGLMQADGIHPNSKAQHLLLENAWPIMRAPVQLVCGGA